MPSSSPARWVSRGTMSIRQQKWSAPRGAVRTQRLSGGELAEPAPQPRERVVQERGAERPVVLEPRARAARGEHELEREPRRVRRHQDRLAVDRDDPLAPPDLLLHEVAEEVAAHRPRRVRAEALALARHGGGDEVERIELRVRVRERGAAEVALVDDHVDVGRVGVCAHPLAPRRHRARDLVRLEVAERADGVGRVDDHLVGAGGRLRAEQVGDGLGLQRLETGGEGGELVRDGADGPAGAVGAAAVRPHGGHLGRRLVLVPGEERVALRVDRGGRVEVEGAAGAVLAGGGDDHLEPAERVDANLACARRRSRLGVHQPR